MCEEKNYMSTRYKFSDEDFIDAVKNSFSKAEIIKKLGLATDGGSYRQFNIRIKKLNIDTNHFTGRGHLKGKTHNWSKKTSLEDLLIENSNQVFRTSFKDRLIKEGLLSNNCYQCSINNEWNNKPLVLQTDHINGDPFDHRIENLRLLCPNCHSQTDTFCSKNSERHKNKPLKIKPIYKQQVAIYKKCGLCDKQIYYNSIYCRSCYDSNRKLLQSKNHIKTKIIWPDLEFLLERLKTISYVKLGKELGVSDNAIRKHIHKFGSDGRTRTDKVV